MIIRFNSLNIHNMFVFIRIIIFTLLLWLWISFFFPDLINIKFLNTPKKINIEKYILTPDPSVLFLLSLKISTSKNYDLNWIASATDLYFQSVKLFDVNIINLLDNSKSKKLALKTYLTQLHNILNNLDNTITNLNMLYTENNSMSNNYLQQKKIWDSTFHNWIVEKDSKSVFEWLETSYKNWPKYIKHRIIANAARIINWKLQTIKQWLFMKNNLLETNQESIINNFELIKWNLLPKLLEIKKRLENNYY